MDVIIYPCQGSSWFMLVKGDTGQNQEQRWRADSPFVILWQSCSFQWNWSWHLERAVPTWDTHGACCWTISQTVRHLSLLRSWAQLVVCYCMLLITWNSFTQFTGGSLASTGQGFVSTVQCRYHTVNVIPNPRNKHPIAHPLGRDLYFVKSKSAPCSRCCHWNAAISIIK